MAITRNKSSTSTATSTSTRTVDRTRMEQEELSKVLAESESQYRRSQQLLEQKEAEQLEYATLESKTLQEIHSARLSLLEQAEQETLDLVIQHSQQLNSPIAQDEIQERERLELELALALSLNQANNTSVASPQTHVEEQDHEQDPFDETTEESQPDEDPFEDPSPAQDNSIDHIEILCQSLSARRASNATSPSEPPPQSTASLSLLPVPPPSSLPPSAKSPASVPLPPSVASSGLLPSQPLAVLPTSSSSASSSHVHQLPPSSTSSSYFPNRRVSPPSPPFLGKPLPPVPDRSKKPTLHQTVSHDEARSGSSRLSVCTQNFPASNLNAPQSSSSTGPSFSSSPMAYDDDELPSCELLSPQTVNSPYKPCSPESQLSPHSQLSVPPTSTRESVRYTIIPAHESFTSTTNDRREDEVNPPEPSTIDVTITACSSARPSRPPSPITANPSETSTSIMTSDPFDANPAPPENVTEGIQFGSTKALIEPLVSVGQFPNVVELTQFLRGSTTKRNNPLFAIQASSWNRLLAYLMWHGNSRIEPGPLDITEAEDEGLGTWLAGMSVIFQEGAGSASVRLVLELVAGNGESQWDRKDSTGGRRHSSVVIGPSNHSKRDESHLRSQHPEVIHLPKPFLTLPIQLSTLACNLHEIHSVSRMSSSIHTGITCSFKSNKHKNKNIIIYTKLSKAIENNARILNEVNEEEEEGDDDHRHHDTDKFMERSKKWLKKKKIELSSSSSTPPSTSNSNLHLLLLNSNSNHTHDHNRKKKFTKVDGSGLPLPDGATMVRPWDCDWS